MKANEAPEKVYIEPNLDSIWGMAERSCESEVEYVKTDAFIEKACDFISSLRRLDDNVIEEFKKYMKGE